jgi:hypothetical protein
VLDDPDTSILPTDQRAGVSWLRRHENDLLVRAVTSLRLDGILSEAEYQAKRQRLAAQR